MAEDNVDLPPLSFAEIGYNGLRVTAGRIQEECDVDLQYPRCIQTFKRMAKDGTIAPALDYVQIMIAQVPWYVKAVKGKEEESEEYVKYLSSVMGDMEQSWLTFVKQAVSFVKYGHSVFETVPSLRLRSEGSKYNDGYYGLRKLALRSQDTIVAWNYNNKGRDLKGIIQKVNIPTNKNTLGNTPTVSTNQDNGKTEKFIPAKRLLLFRNNPEKDSPLGTSPLVGCYEAFRMKKAYEQSERHGSLSDLHGFKVLKIPPQYLQENATAEDKATLAHFQEIMERMHIGEESGLILPNITDPNSTRGDGLFEFDVISLQGAKSYDVNKIISRYQREILTSLYASFLTLGQDGGGSYALSESMIDFVELVIRSKLEEIRDVLNHTLVPRLWEWNGWEPVDLPTFEFGQINRKTLEEFSKGIQRIGAVGLIARTPRNINFIATELQLPDMVSEDMEFDDLMKLLGKDESKSGEGMSEGMPSGTGSSNGNNSATNNDNKG